MRCCSYGSRKQQKDVAEFIAQAIVEKHARRHMTSPRITELNHAVTDALFELEEAERSKPWMVTDSYRKVAEIERQLSQELHPDTVEGRIARIGAVRAAIKTEDLEYALEVVESLYDEAKGRKP